jgi:hypothetical protein
MVVGWSTVFLKKKIAFAQSLQEVGTAFMRAIKKVKFPVLFPLKGFLYAAQ